MTSPERTERLVLPGVLTAEQARTTVEGILAGQRADGALPWFRGHHLDPWDHVEAAMALDAAGEHERAAAAYDWLAAHQLPDGSWYAAYADGDAARPTDRTRETNFCAYPAVGVWHHYLSTGDDAFVDRMWPMVVAAVEFVLRLQQPGGQIGWKRDADGTATAEALLTGSSSVYQALRCALALAERREEPQPDWELAAGWLGHAVRSHPERFLDKSRYSMDWYYPVARRRGAARARGQGAHRGGLGPLRRARSGCALRGPQPVGDRRGERGTGAGAVGDGRVGPRAGYPALDAASAGRGRHVLDGVRLRRRGGLARGADDLDGGCGAAGGGRARRGTTRRCRSSAATNCRRGWNRTAADRGRAGPRPGPPGAPPPVPSRIREVCAAIRISAVNASDPQDSAGRTEW